MKDEDLLKCPLLQGLDAMHRAELLGLLKDSNLQEKLEQCLTERLKAHGEEVCACSEAKPLGTFEESAHNWSPGAPLWRRSAKE